MSLESANWQSLTEFLNCSKHFQSTGASFLFSFLFWTAWFTSLRTTLCFSLKLKSSMARLVRLFLHWPVHDWRKTKPNKRSSCLLSVWYERFIAARWLNKIEERDYDCTVFPTDRGPVFCFFWKRGILHVRMCKESPNRKNWFLSDQNLVKNRCLIKKQPKSYQGSDSDRF